MNTPSYITFDEPDGLMAFLSAFSCWHPKSGVLAREAIADFIRIEKTWISPLTKPATRLHVALIEPEDFDAHFVTQGDETNPQSWVLEGHILHIRKEQPSSISPRDGALMAAALRHTLLMRRIDILHQTLPDGAREVLSTHSDFLALSALVAASAVRESWLRTPQHEKPEGLIFTHMLSFSRRLRDGQGISPNDIARFHDDLLFQTGDLFGLSQINKEGAGKAYGIIAMFGGFLRTDPEKLEEALHLTENPFGPPPSLQNYLLRLFALPHDVERRFENSQMSLSIRDVERRAACHFLDAYRAMFSCAMARQTAVLLDKVQPPQTAPAAAAPRGQAGWKPTVVGGTAYQDGQPTGRPAQLRAAPSSQRKPGVGGDET